MVCPILQLSLWTIVLCINFSPLVPDTEQTGVSGLDITYWNQTRNVDTFGLWCQLQEGVQVSQCQLLEQVEYSSPSAGTGKTVTVGTGVSETSERLSISG